MKYFLSELKYILNEHFTRLIPEHNHAYLLLKRSGYIVVEDFLSAEKCQELRKEIDINCAKDYVWKDTVGSDKRIYGIEDVSLPFKSIFNTPFLDSLYKKHIDKENRNEFIMANKLQFKHNNEGSGGGWHRDSLNRRQLKFIVYLSDVNTDTGCFQYIKNTHSPKQKLKINRILNKKLAAYRYTDQDIKLLLTKGYEKVDFIGKAGTLLIVETSGIHRGKPIESGGIRYAATNYLSETIFAPQLRKEFVNQKK